MNTPWILREEAAESLVEQTDAVQWWRVELWTTVLWQEFCHISTLAEGCTGCPFLVVWISSHFSTSNSGSGSGRKAKNYWISKPDTVLIMVALCNRADHYIFAL